MVEKKSKLPSTMTSLEWATIPGTMAWARRPGDNDALWWPCILYPSWSYSVKNSGFLLPLDEDGCSKQLEAIQIMGCKKPVAIRYLAKNLVPQKAALGPCVTTANNTQRRSKAVAHFLGLSTTTPQWGAVSIDSSFLKPYIPHLLDTVANYKGKVKRADWLALKHAMLEASVALERHHDLNPDAILNRLLILHENNQDVGETPEDFDDWRSGGYTQSQSQRSQFGLVRFSQTSLKSQPFTEVVGGVREMNAKPIIDDSCLSNSTKREERDGVLAAIPFPETRVTNSSSSKNETHDSKGSQSVHWSDQQHDLPPKKNNCTDTCLDKCAIENSVGCEENEQPEKGHLSKEHELPINASEQPMLEIGSLPQEQLTCNENLASSSPEQKAMYTLISPLLLDKEIAASVEKSSLRSISETVSGTKFLSLKLQQVQNSTVTAAITPDNKQHGEEVCATNDMTSQLRRSSNTPSMKHVMCSQTLKEKSTVDAVSVQTTTTTLINIPIQHSTSETNKKTNSFTTANNVESRQQKSCNDAAASAPTNVQDHDSSIMVGLIGQSNNEPNQDKTVPIVTQMKQLQCEETPITVQTKPTFQSALSNNENADISDPGDCTTPKVSSVELPLKLPSGDSNLSPFKASRLFLHEEVDDREKNVPFAVVERKDLQCSFSQDRVKAGNDLSSFRLSQKEEGQSRKRIWSSVRENDLSSSTFSHSAEKKLNHVGKTNEENTNRACELDEGFDEDDGPEDDLRKGDHNDLVTVKLPNCDVTPLLTQDLT